MLIYVQTERAQRLFSQLPRWTRWLIGLACEQRTSYDIARILHWRPLAMKLELDLLCDRGLLQALEIGVPHVQPTANIQRPTRRVHVSSASGLLAA